MNKGTSYPQEFMLIFIKQSCFLNSDLNAEFLKSLQRDCLLFREDNIHACDHFVPFTTDPLTPIESGKNNSTSLYSDPGTLKHSLRS